MGSVAEKRKEAFAEALLKELHKLPVEKITIDQLALDCEVSRKTFYYYFEDIYDLFKWIIHKEVIEKVKALGTEDSALNRLTIAFDYVDSNKRILNNVYQALGRDRIYKIIYDDYFWIVSGSVRLAERDVHKKLDEDFFMFFTTCCMQIVGGTMINILTQEFPYDDKYTAKDIAPIFNATLRECVRYFGTPVNEEYNPI